MFGSPHLTALRGLTVAVCFALLAGCGGGSKAETSSTNQVTPPGGSVEMPAAPTGLAATAGNAQASLSWSASTGATSYHVKRAKTSGGPYTAVSAPVSTAYSDTSLTNATKYFYVVSALNSAGEGANSTEVSATPQAPTVAPATPTNIAATAGNGQINLTWGGSSGATSYHVKRSLTSGGPYSQAAAPSTASYTSTGLTNGTTYYYVVSAVNSAGESANSAQASATPQVPPSAGLAAPSTLKATAGDTTASLAWSLSSGATGYHVKRSTTSGGPYAQTATATAASFTDTGLTNGTTYYYVVSALGAAGESANSAQVSALPKAPTGTAAANACGQILGDTPITFCDTFDAPAPTASRSGDLNANVWGVSRQMGAGTNFGGSQYNMWNPTLIDKCDGTQPRVIAPNDVIICNGQLREAMNDNNSGAFDEGDVGSLAMYPKQPFDFAGRTGTVSFDVSNDSAGSHAVWPEFWLSDLPVPDPFNHFDSWQSMPANGFGLRFHAAAPPGQWGSCPNGNNINVWRWTIGSAVASRGYVLDDTEGFGAQTSMNVTQLDCVISAVGPGQMNHVELRISQNQTDVYATDAGVAATAATLKHIAVITNTNLSLSRGLIWIEDAHYNADKSGQPIASQREHTFAWDNVAFDGPFVYRDFSYDALDNTAPAVNGAINLGKLSQPNQPSTWNVAGLPANPTATAARVLFNFSAGGNPNPTTLTVNVNGHAHSVPWPYPDNLITLRTFAITIPITDLVAGTNVLQLGADTAQAFYNVNIVLVDVTGGVPVLPGNPTGYPGS
jgi:fibronectin type 3 domain-containing protein